MWVDLYLSCFSSGNWRWPQLNHTSQIRNNRSTRLSWSSVCSLIILSIWFKPLPELGRFCDFSDKIRKGVVTSLGLCLALILWTRAWLAAFSCSELVCVSTSWYHQSQRLSLSNLTRRKYEYVNMSTYWFNSQRQKNQVYQKCHVQTKTTFALD